MLARNVHLCLRLAEAIKLLRDYLAVISLVLAESRASGEMYVANIEATALLVLSLTESYVLSAKVLGQSEQQIAHHASFIASFILQGCMMDKVD